MVEPIREENKAAAAAAQFEMQQEEEKEEIKIDTSGDAEIT